jgi:hypothetical protein
MSIPLRPGLTPYRGVIPLKVPVENGSYLVVEEWGSLNKKEGYFQFT